jgi:hypothetical protein
VQADMLFVALGVVASGELRRGRQVYFHPCILVYCMLGITHPHWGLILYLYSSASPSHVRRQAGSQPARQPRLLFREVWRLGRVGATRCPASQVCQVSLVCRWGPLQKLGLDECWVDITQVGEKETQATCCCGTDNSLLFSLLVPHLGWACAPNTWGPFHRCLSCQGEPSGV